MYLVNGFKAKLIQYNRNNINSYYDDQDQQEVNIKIVPYNTDDSINFGTYTTPEATGYFIVPRKTDIKEGDQIVYKDKTYTILKVSEGWAFNRIENYIVAVK